MDVVIDLDFGSIKSQEEEFKAHVQAAKAELGLTGVSGDTRWPKIQSALESDHAFFEYFGIAHIGYLSV